MLENFNPVALVSLFLGLALAVYSLYQLAKYGVALLVWTAFIVVGILALSYGWENLGLSLQAVSPALFEKVQESRVMEVFQEWDFKENFQAWCAAL